VERALLEEHPRKSEMCFKPNVHARIGRLQQCDELKKVLMPRCSDVGRFIEVNGTIIRTGMVKSLEWEQMYECATCKFQFPIHADLEQKNTFPKITKCPSKKAPPCQSKTFRFIPGSAKCRDYQEIKIQEHVSKLGVGSIPRSLVVILSDDLVDTPKAGDDVTISGIVKRRWKFMWENQRCDLELVLEANYLHINNEQKFQVNITEELIADFKKYWSKYQDTPLLGKQILLSTSSFFFLSLFFWRRRLLSDCCLWLNRTRFNSESHLSKRVRHVHRQTGCGSGSHWRRPPH
jgi:DNA helicase MCM9